MFKIDIIYKISDIFSVMLYSSRIGGSAFVTAFLPFLAALVMLLPARGADMANYALCDVRVLYLFDDPTRIDWPTIYYLNDYHGCRVDVVSLSAENKFRKESHELTDKQLFLHNYMLPVDDSLWLDSLAADLFRERRPDIIIFGNLNNRQLDGVFKEYVMNLPYDDRRVFNILKVYRLLNRPDDETGSGPTVSLNSRELSNRYADRLNSEVTYFFPWYRREDSYAQKLVHYALIRKHQETHSPEPDFLSGINPTRLVGIIEGLPVTGPMKTTFQKQARKFVGYFGAARKSVGRNRADLIVNGYRELMFLGEQTASAAATETATDFQQFIRDLLARAERAALQAAGVTWEGQIILRDSPHGPRLKFIAAVSANGPQAVRLANIKFHPHWDTTVTVLDERAVNISPHQSYVKEYLIDIERSRLETQVPESLSFSAEIVYGQIPLEVYTTLPLWKAPDIQINFDPDFFFVPPVATLDVDRVISSMNWKVIITKPYEFSGKVKINLATPRGLFAGAYRQELTLDKGSRRETVRIPFTVSKLFEQGIQNQTVTLSMDDRLVAADTGRVRIASCEVADTIRVGFMPDTTGLLEDALRLTDAAFSPLTDRTLVTADLDAYNVIVMGSGCFRRYPSLREVTDRFEDYLRYGGSVVVFGQPDDWPQGLLPVSLAPAGERLQQAEISCRIENARILSQPHEIKTADLLGYFADSRLAASAVVSPAERVFTTASGGTLLSVSRIGDGQVIFCGLPLLEMISELDLEAIHLFSNILNY